MNALEALYVDNAGRIDGIPEFHGIDEKYLAHLGKPFAEGTTWEQFTQEIDRERSHLTAQIDPRLPVYDNEERKGWCAFECPEEAREKMSSLCAAAPIPEGENGAPEAARIMLHMIRRLAKWYRLPRAGVEEKNADFAFYRLRCLMACAGYPAWNELATEIVTQVGECPYDPEETYEVWSKALIDAHRTCGWPSTLLWIDWNELPDNTPSEWTRICALAHVFKHLRRAADHLHMVYNGNVEFLLRQPNTGSSGSQRSIGTPQFWQAYSRVLGKPPSSKGSAQSTKADALEWALANLGVDDLLPAEPIAVLPGSVLAGTWSTLLPAVREGTPGFFNPGTRLTGVWRAADGRVAPFEGDEGDCLDWAWNTSSASRSYEEQTRFAKRLPRTYPTTAPSVLLRKVFPNWVLPDPTEQPSEFAAYCAIVDAVLCAGILRADRDDLTREFPLIAILPISPSAEESTNQGKGLLTAAIAGAFVPGIQLLTAPDSGSAPDSRAVASDLEAFGTLALDEFQIPGSRAHCLSRDNLQSLCTGGQVTAGKVYENAGKIRLRHSLVMNAKWLDMSDDLVNRTVPLFLDALPDEQRNRTDIKEMLENGQVATLLRLAAVSLVEAAGLTTLGQPPAKTTSEAWRFTCHRLIAAALYMRAMKVTDWDVAFAAIDDARSSFGDDLRRHQQLADETGVSATTQSGVNLRLSWPAFWTGADDRMMANLVGFIDREGEARTGGCKWVPISQLLKFRNEDSGSPSPSFARLLPVLTGQEARVSNTAVVRSLTLAARAYYAAQIAKKETVWTPIPGDAGVKWEAAVVQRSWNGDSPSARSLCVAVRMKGVA